MKYIVFIMFVFLGCTPKQINSKPPGEVLNQIPEVSHKCPEPIYIHDTILVPEYHTVFIEKKYDSLLGIIKKKNDSLFIERYKIERVKYYNSIVRKNKTQLKFLSGWITRAVK